MDPSVDSPISNTAPQIPPRPAAACYSNTTYCPMRQPCYTPFMSGTMMRNSSAQLSTNNPTNYQLANAVQYTPTYPYYQPLFRDNATVCQMELNSRNALKPVETFISTLTSVAQTLDTTLNAFYTSFYAMIGLADHFVGLKHNLQRIFTTLAALRFVRWLWRKFLALARLSKHVTPAEQTLSSLNNGWNQAGGDFSNVASPDLTNTSSVWHTSWSSLAFFAVAIGGPVLIYKLVTKLVSNIENERRWTSGESDHYAGVALYNFTAASPGEISITANQKLRIAPKDLQPAVRGWLLATVDGNDIGLVPANHVRVLGLVTGSSPLSKDIPFV